MKKFLHFNLHTLALIISGQLFARAGELFFGEGDEWVVFQGPILTKDIDGLLFQLDNKKPKLILLNSIVGNVSGAIRFAQYLSENEMNTGIAKG